VLDLNQRHRDLTNLDLTRLGLDAVRIRDSLRLKDSWRRFREAEVIAILCAAVRAGRLDVNNVEEGLRETVQRRCLP
jgi:hypothetical protein